MDRRRGRVHTFLENKYKCTTGMKIAIQKEELIDLVRTIMEVKGTKEKIDNWIDSVEAYVPHPSVSNLIFYSKEPLTPEEVIEKALAYMPILL